MSEKIYDAIVIGAGGMGSAAAYHLAKSGAQTLVLEQFSRGHALGSSHGSSRVIRLFYNKKFYTELMKYAYAEWRKLEEESKKQLIYITGGVIIALEGQEYIMDTRASLDAAGVASEWWTPQQLEARYPQFRVQEGMRILWQQDTGFLYASECVLTHLELAEQHGAEVRENMPVQEIDWQGDLPVVTAKGTRFHGRKVVVTAGPWAGQILKDLHLPLTVTRQQIVYYRPQDPTLFQIGRFPVFSDRTWDEAFYGFPLFAREGVKVARHGLGQAVSPDTCNRTVDADYIEHLRTFLRERIPAADGEALEAQVCLYTETPDTDFIVDAHPHCPNLFLAAGFSGHGFKFCSLVGRILSEMVLKGETSFDISPFRLARFGGSK